ncbi:MAG: hypothetical protein AB3N14_10015 [Flavobacteriaceae bacterium]
MTAFRYLPMIIMLFGSTCLFGQREVFPCSRINPRPIEIDPMTNDSTDILAIYLDGDGTGIGGRGCWVHHDTGTNNYVVTPHSWERAPNGPRQGLIDDALKAMEKSRVEFRNFGTLDNDLYYVLDDRPDPGYSGFAYWLVGNSCWMNTQVPSYTGVYGDDRRHGFAHEVGHCFVMENVPKLKNHYALNSWFDESVSEYLASEAYKEVNSEHVHSRSFNIDGQAFTQDYKAWSLWYYYALKNGKGSVVPLMKSLTEQNTRSSRLAYLRSIGFDELYHEFLFELFQVTLEDSGGTGPIPTEIPVEPINEYELDPSQTSLDLPTIAPERLQYFKLIVPAGFQVKLTPPIGPDVSIFRSYTDDKGGERKLWDAPIIFDGDCSTSTEVNLLLSHLNSTPVTGLTLLYEMEAKVNCCTDVEATLDACLIGSWEVDVSTVSHLLDYNISGTLKVTFEDRPTGQLNATFDLRFDFPDNGGVDIHRGTVSACVIPEGRGGPLNYFSLSGVTLGAGNIHTHTRRGETYDLTEDVLEGLNRFRFNYTTCEPDWLTVLYAVRMKRL